MSSQQAEVRRITKCQQQQIDLKRRIQKSEITCKKHTTTSQIGKINNQKHHISIF